MDLSGLATTKIQPPRARTARIVRPALDGALRDALHHKRLVLLVAPAGFGKTSALAGQIAALPKGTALAWVSLDEDDDPARLFSALAASEAPHGLIVFDDLHRVQSPEVHALLDALIERLPPQWTVVISTRIAPRLALSRWRAADE